MAEWKFREMAKSEVGKNPVESEFFTTDSVGSISAALVRESIQNSLDARSDNSKPIQFRFFFRRGKEGLKFSEYKHLFRSIDVHLNSKDNGLRKSQIPDLKSGMPCLIIEDGNTDGLEGSTTISSDPDEDDKNNFYWFWRNVGRSGKGKEDRGRWGLGKTVFPSASMTNTFFGFSVRKSDQKRSLMGQCVLKIHKTGSQNKRVCPYGYYGNFLDEDDKYFATPEEAKKILNRINEKFKLIRNHNPGLSIIIPFPWKEITYNSILKELIKQYYYAILSNDLTVDIEDPSNSLGQVVNSSGIEKVIDDFKNDNELYESKYKLKKICSLSNWTLSLEEEEIIKLDTPPSTQNMPMWKKDWFVNDEIEKEIEEQKKYFEKGKRVAFNIPVKVHEKGKDAIFTYFKVVLEHDENLDEADCNFIRDGITITGIKPFNKKGLRALVLIDDKYLSQLLGDSENPAHTEWQKNSKNFKGKYVHGDKVISFVTSSIEQLYSWLHIKSEGIEEDLLIDFFSIQIDDSYEEELSGIDEESPGDETGDEEIEIKERSKKLFKLNKIENGFSITNTKSRLDGKVRLKMAYSVSRGNPLKRYSIHDFRLDNMSLEIQKNNVRIEILDKNILEFKPTAHDFSLKITGFDSQRDLVIDSKTI